MLPTHSRPPFSASTARLLASLLAGAVLAACAIKMPRPSAVAAAGGDAKLRFVERTLVRNDPQCGGRDACASIRLSWPRVSAGPEAARLAIADAIDGFVLARVGGEGRASSPDEVADSFLTAFHAFRQETPTSPQIWTVSRSVRVIFASAEVVSLAFDSAEFIGGAHPASTRLMATFDAVTGRRFALQDLVPPDRAEALRLLVERRFREARGLKAGGDWSAHGFEFDSGRFRLTENFAVLGAGLLFHWNPGEVAPLAKGSTEVRLSREDLINILPRR